MVPLHLAYIFQENGDVSWVTQIPAAGSDAWGVRTFGTPMEVAMPLTGAEVRRFKAYCKRKGFRCDSAYASSYGLSSWARSMRPDTRG